MKISKGIIVIISVFLVVVGYIGGVMIQDYVYFLEDQNERAIIMNISDEEITSPHFTLVANRTYDIIVYHSAAEGSGILTIVDETTGVNTSRKILYQYDDEYYDFSIEKSHIKERYNFKGRRAYQSIFRTPHAGDFYMVYSPESYNSVGSWANVELKIREDIAVDTLGFDSSVLLFIPMGIIGIGIMGIVYPLFLVLCLKL